MGEHEKAFEYHNISKKIKPEAEEVKFNEKYFESVRGWKSGTESLSQAYAWQLPLGKGA